MGAGIVLGAIWGFLLPSGLGGLSFLGLLLAFLLGYLIAQSVNAAANRRSGWPLQVVAVLGVVVAYITRNLVGDQTVFPANDVSGYISTVVAAAVAYYSLR